jgi:uncharacterized protein YyaL (SSP411 family)
MTLRYIVVLLLFSGIFISCNNISKSTSIHPTPTYKNRLSKETSPYLLQHANNPVDWRAWNNETLKKAKEDKKLIVISIGYAACHWCHVMEKESFQDTAVAAIMNAKFISIKVDREERPDIDKIYINAVQLLTGSAGWPLNVIALPDGRPIWGGTYFTKKDWMSALDRIQELYEQDPQKLYGAADKLEEGIKAMDLVPLNTSDVDFKKYPSEQSILEWSKSFDKNYGGTNRAPKFMMPNDLSFFLRQAMQTKNNELLRHTTLTLNKIAYGGVYDHVGGGFSRYSVDKKWHIPHFEKMLYDNGQLVSLYSDAFLATKNPLYKEVVIETLDFITREFTNNEGAFYSSYHADSANENGEFEEGAYYRFTKAELKSVIDGDFDIFSDYYNITSFGKWEKDYFVLIRSKSDVEILEKFSITQEQLDEKKKDWKSKLMAYRNKRPKPGLDDKILTSWNGLMLNGYIDAYKALDNKEYLDAAIKNANFIISKQLQKNGSLFHNYKDGKSTINGYLEDYAIVANAFISLYEVTLDEHWLTTANDLTKYAFDHFFDSEKQLFYFTSDLDTALVTRSFEFRDNVIPSSNSIMAHNLFKLSHYFDNKNYAAVSQQMLKNVMPEMKQYPEGFSNWLSLLLNYKENYYEIVVVGPEAQEKLKKINQYYLPHILIAGSTTKGNKPLLLERFIEGETFIYVCVNNACKLPQTEVKKAIQPIAL